VAYRRVAVADAYVTVTDQEGFLMGRTWEEIFFTVQSRRRADSAMIRRMRTIADHFHGDIVIPLPDVLEEPDLPPLMPQLIHDAIETNGMKAAGARPDLDCPALDPYDEHSVERARDRRRAYRARWYSSQLELLMGRAFRQGVAYGTWHFAVIPDYEHGGAKIQLRNPLSAYPELRDDDEIRNPLNVGYVVGRSIDWLRRAYPEKQATLSDWRHFEDQLWDVCEWVDMDDVVLGVLGPRSSLTDPIESFQGFELKRHPNKAGMVPVVAPRRLTLERIAGQLDQMVGMVDWMARLMALDVIAAERATFPDMVAIGEDGRPPELSSGRWQDGRTGDINRIVARDVKLIRTDPGQMTGQMLDRIERAGRFSAGVPAVTGGEFTGSIRSGRVVDNMAAFSIDPRIAELQQIMSRALVCVNDAVAATEQGCFPGKTFTVFSGWPGDQGTVEYTPEVFAESTASVVSYPMPGADLSSISVAAAQLVGAGLSSRRTARRLHPYIDDPIAEETQIEIERLEEATMVALQQGATTGQVAFIDLVAIIDNRKRGDSLIDAVVNAQKAAQERQAAAAPAPEPPAQMAPEQMPGLNAPGAGAESQPPTPTQVGPPPRDLRNLEQLLGALRAG
jgi:hypothetical protein